MSPEGIRTLLRQQPFKPFRLVMSSGKEYEVRHPEMAMLLRNDILVGTDITDNGMPAEFDICPLLHVASIEPFNLHDANPAA
jgi:hypothetical protein